MATVTDNYGLRKPTNADLVSVDRDISGNMDLIDQALAGKVPLPAGVPAVGQTLVVLSVSPLTLGWAAGGGGVPIGYTTSAALTGAGTLTATVLRASAVLVGTGTLSALATAPGAAVGGYVGGYPGGYAGGQAVPAADLVGTGTLTATATTPTASASATLTGTGTLSAVGDVAATISFAALTDGASTSDQTVYTTASITPAANKLILLFLGIGDAAAGGADEAPSSVTGNGLTWVQVGFDQRGTSNYGNAVYRAMGASPTTGAVSVTFTNAQDGLIWHVVEVTGADTGGTNGSAAVVEWASGEGTTNSTTPATYTLADVGAGNATIASSYLDWIDPANFINLKAGWTQIGNAINGGTPPAMAGLVAAKAAGETTFTHYSVNSQNYTGSIVEIKHA